MENKNQDLLSFSFKSGLTLACLSFFAAGINKVGIRNNCEKCMVAVVHWDSGYTRQYQVKGYNQIIIEMESGHGQLIGEQPC